jgi:DNA-binding PadR family transcriptional regulator
VLEEFRKVRHGLKGSQLSNIADKAQSMGLIMRKIVRQERGRPKIVFELTEKGLQTLGIGVGLGASTKAGGELHRAMILELKERLSKQGYYIEHEEQAGTEYQPDLIARERTPEGRWGREIAIEVETDAKHPEQVRRNFEKNLLAGREIVFVVPSERVKKRVESILGEDAEYVEVEVFKGTES